MKQGWDKMWNWVKQGLNKMWNWMKQEWDKMLKWSVKWRDHSEMIKLNCWQLVEFNICRRYLGQRTGDGLWLRIIPVQQPYNPRPGIRNYWLFHYNNLRSTPGIRESYYSSIATLRATSRVTGLLIIQLHQPYDPRSGIWDYCLFH